MAWPPGSHLFRKKGPSLFAFFPSPFFVSFWLPKCPKKEPFLRQKWIKNLTKTEKGEKPIRAYPPMKNQLFQGRKLPKTHQITSLFRVRISTSFLLEKSPFWGAILAPWTPQGPPFLVKMGWGTLAGSSFFQKCVRWSPFGRPK